MIVFTQMGIMERIKRFWPAYRRRRDDEMKAAIRYLVRNPEVPCTVGGHFIPNGYGRNVSLSNILLDDDQWQRP